MIKRGPRRKAVSGGAGATLAMLLLCCCGGLFALGDDDDPDGTAVSPWVQTSEIGTPVAPEPTTEPTPWWSREPQDTGTPVDAEEAACVTRSEHSAAMVHFAEDYSEVCVYLPDYDFGVSAKTYDRCVRTSRKYHVERHTYEYTCRYDRTHQWTEIDDPDHTYTPNVRDYAYPPEVPDHDQDGPGRSHTPNVPVHNYTPSVPVHSYTPSVPVHSYPPSVPVHSYPPSVPDRDYTPDVPDNDYDSGGTDNGSGTPPDGLDLSDHSHGGCTWVNSYHRKDGTYVSGYYRC